MANSGLIVHAGPHARKNCPVTVKLPQKAGKQPRAVTLTTDSGAKLVGQVCAPHPFGCGCGADAGVRIAFVLPDLPAGGSLRLTAELTDKAPAADAVTVSDDKAGQVHVKVGGDLLTTYRYTGNPARPCFFPGAGPSPTMCRARPPTTTIIAPCGWRMETSTGPTTGAKARTTPSSFIARFSPPRAGRCWAGWRRRPTGPTSSRTR